MEDDDDDESGRDNTDVAKNSASSQPSSWFSLPKHNDVCI